MTAKPRLRWDMNLLPMYFPDIHPPFDRYFEEVLDEVCLAEELGFECYWFTEHHFLLYGGPICNPAVFISAAAARTKKIKLGTAISIVPLRHPLQTAEDYAMADAISGGRLEFGVGRGNVQIDYDTYRIDRDESRPRFEEAMDAILGVWSNEKYSHHGRYWEFDNVGVYPRPTQKPHPHLWVAGNSPESGLWAGRHGFDLMQVAHVRPPEMLRPNVAAWKEGLAERGETPEQHNNQMLIRVWVDENADKAHERAHYALERFRSLSNRDGRTTGWTQADYDGMLATGRSIFGDPEQCIQGVKNALTNFEFDTMAVSLNWGGIPHDEVMRGMKLWAREVVPAFQ
ncbi:MAG TPA: LLM class flavin-dependent oxidoreductase [Chloroflexota bacterium]|nr:LLM class flavin-dependent oxidoreductase [Chloroflexota bacterium]